MLGYLTPRDAMRALANTHAMLRPGGIFRFVDLDYGHFMRHYLENPSENAARHFLTLTGFGRERRSFAALLKEYLGHPNRLWMWDRASLGVALSAVGFVNVREAAMGDSGDPNFADVEEQEAWRSSFGMQATAP